MSTEFTDEQAQLLQELLKQAKLKHTQMYRSRNEALKALIPLADPFPGGAELHPCEDDDSKLEYATCITIKDVRHAREILDHAGVEWNRGRNESGGVIEPQAEYDEHGNRACPGCGRYDC